MIYPHLPAIGALSLPKLVIKQSPNRSSRNGRRARLIFVHVWGGGHFDSVVDWLTSKQSGVSSHLVFAGHYGPDAGKAAQLVKWTEKAWTECELNPVGISVESADAIWQGHDPDGFAQLARVVAGLCHFHLDACRPVDAHGIVAGTHGFTRHADAGALGCGHVYCPTTDMALWHQFSERVVAEYRHGGFRPSWGV